jgi:thymidylate synthase (FAD)
MAEISLTSEIKVRQIQRMGGDYMVVGAMKVSTSGEEAILYAPTNFKKAYIESLNTIEQSRMFYTVKKWREERIAKNLPPDPTDEELAEENKGKIKYLMAHRHGTPFEHSALTFFVHAPILVWREWHRHRIGFSYNEESGRYKTLEPMFYIPPRERPMMKVDNWKPGRPKFLQCEDDSTYTQLCTNLTESYQLSYNNYLKNLALNVDPGLARDCLPVGIYSSCWVTCNPRSLMAFLSLRTHEPEAKFPSYPLYEIEVAARVAEIFLAEGWPITYSAWNECGRVAP